MAEALLKARVPGSVDVHSAGIGALVDKPAHPVAVELMQAQGMDLTAHRARQLTPDMVDQAELILVMEDRHQKHIRSVSPAASGKIFTLGKWIAQDIPDPYQQSPEFFMAVLGLIEQGVDSWVARLWPQGKQD